VFEVHKLKKIFLNPVLPAVLVVIQTCDALAGGGLVIEDDMCLIRIDFYSAHFTAYQPNSSGNTQFCQDFPDTGETIIVLDYLHQSLKEVPVDFRIIRNVTGQGSYVKLKHINAIKDIEQHTVFYQPPVIRSDASLKIEYTFIDDGSYIGIVNAGHPSTDTIYTAVFPFEVGGTNYGYPLVLVLVLAVSVFYYMRRVSRVRRAQAGQGAAL